MVLLDTNLVSEPLRHAPETRVIEWIDAQPLEALFLAAIAAANGLAVAVGHTSPFEAAGAIVVNPWRA